MSMLAGPRRKQKVINLRAKNSAWSNDSNKFGQRMLEKMGWSSGKGLGANENGMVEHVVARYKNDEKGLGFEDRNDQWTKHEDDFNSLLANLSNGDDTNNKKEMKLHSGVSLEDKSKKSKARVHYHKFTRGKDLTRYSEKDLANIFGKKSLKNVEEKHETETKEDVKNTEQIFTEKGSMADYFKNKLANLKTKVSINFRDQEDNEADYSFKGFAGTGNNTEENDNHVAFQGFSFYSSNKKEDTVPLEDTAPSEDIAPIKKSKKKKKSKKDVSDSENQELNQELIVNNEVEAEVHPVKRKKSKNKNKDVEANSEQIIEEKAVEENDHVPKKKKKRKNKDIES